MGHVLALLLEDCGLRPRIGLDGHESNHEALLRGVLDLYVEYTGTALRRLLHLGPVPRDRVIETVKREAAARWDLIWLPPFGFDNTYGVIVGRRLAGTFGLARISDLGPHAAGLRLGARAALLGTAPESRFAPGGYDGLRQVYGLRFARLQLLADEAGATFEALRRGDVDVVVDFVVHPRIVADGLQVLHDDRGFFPAYEAAPVSRGTFLRANPEAAEAIARLAGRIDNLTAARLTYRVEVEGADPRDVAKAFVTELGSR